MDIIKDPLFRDLRDTLATSFETCVHAPSFRGGYYSSFQINQLIDLAAKIGNVIQGKRVLDFGCGATRPTAPSVLMYLMGAANCLAIDLEDLDDTPGIAVAEYTNILATISGKGRIDYQKLGISLESIRRRAAEFDMAALFGGDLYGGLPAAIKHRICRYQDLPDDEKRFDLMISSSVFEHVDDIGDVLAHARRHIAEDGLIYTSIDYRDHRVYSQGLSSWQYLIDDGDHAPGYINKIRFSKMNALIEDAGFEIVECETLEEAPPLEIIDAILPKYDISQIDLTTLEGQYLLRPRSEGKTRIQ